MAKVRAVCTNLYKRLLLFVRPPDTLPGRAIRLEPGAVYVLELQEHMSTPALERLVEQVNHMGASVGVRFLVLVKGVRIAREQTEGENNATNKER